MQGNKHSGEHATNINLLPSKTLNRISLIARKQLSRDILFPLFDKLSIGLSNSAEEVHSKRIAKVPGNKRLIQNLDLVSSITTSSCSSRLSMLKKELRSLLTTSGGVLGTATVDSSDEEKLFDYSGTLRRLNSKLKSINEEKVTSLFLSGSYNPYLRTSSLPPTHIVFNYLLDPRSLAFDAAYNPLYDEHKDAVVTNRADPLLIPGVASLPFDPNDHPVAKESDTPWHQLVYDFFTKD